MNNNDFNNNVYPSSNQNAGNGYTQQPTQPIQQPMQQPQIDPNKKFCPHCRNQVDANAESCFMCGNKF